MGGLYNMLAGWDPACILLAPMLTDENPEQFFPRFRDCYLGDEGNTIVIFTRVGGGNRSDGPDDEYGYGEYELYDMPTYLRTWDDDFDSTYGYYEFGVPDEWKADFELVKSGKYDELSSAYVERIQGCYKNLDIRDILGKLTEGTSNASQG